MSPAGACPVVSATCVIGRHRLISGCRKATPRLTSTYPER
jgi:hypothetical protein